VALRAHRRLVRRDLPRREQLRPADPLDARVLAGEIEARDELAELVLRRVAREAVEEAARCAQDRRVGIEATVKSLVAVAHLLAYSFILLELDDVSEIEAATDRRRDPRREDHRGGDVTPERHERRARSPPHCVMLGTGAGGVTSPEGRQRVCACSGGSRSRC
jgi:hypothetical protein